MDPRIHQYSELRITRSCGRLYDIADIVSKTVFKFMPFIAYESAIIFVFSANSVNNSYGKTFSGALDTVERKKCVFSPAIAVHL